MNNNETRTLWISVGAALLAIFLLYSWSQKQKSDMSRQYGTSQRVVVASKDIPELQTIDESMITIEEKPVDFLQPGFLKDPEIAVGQIAAAPIKKGEQLLENKLLLPGPETGLSLEVTPGKRALTIPIDDMRGVSRLLRPGDRIDLIGAFDYGRGTEQKREVRTILQDVVILATGVNIVNKIPRRLELDANGKTVTMTNLIGDTSFTNITVEAKPEDVQTLVYVLATNPGGIFAVLRHPNDRYQNVTKSTTAEDVLGRPTLAPRLPAAVVPPVPQQMQPAPVAQPPRRLPAKRNRPGFESL